MSASQKAVRKVKVSMKNPLIATPTPTLDTHYTGLSTYHDYSDLQTHFDLSTNQFTANQEKGIENIAKDVRRNMKDWWVQVEGDTSARSYWEIITLRLLKTNNNEANETLTSDTLEDYLAAHPILNEAGEALEGETLKDHLIAHPTLMDATPQNTNPLLRQFQICNSHQGGITDRFIGAIKAYAAMLPDPTKPKELITQGSVSFIFSEDGQSMKVIQTSLCEAYKDVNAGVNAKIVQDFVYEATSVIEFRVENNTVVMEYLENTITVAEQNQEIADIAMDACGITADDRFVTSVPVETSSQHEENIAGQAEQDNDRLFTVPATSALGSPSKKSLNDIEDPKLKAYISWREYYKATLKSYEKASPRLTTHDDEIEVVMDDREIGPARSRDPVLQNGYALISAADNAAADIDDLDNLTNTFKAATHHLDGLVAHIAPEQSRPLKANEQLKAEAEVASYKENFTSTMNNLSARGKSNIPAIAITGIGLVLAVAIIASIVLTAGISAPLILVVAATAATITGAGLLTDHAINSRKKAVQSCAVAANKAVTNTPRDPEGGAALITTSVATTAELPSTSEGMAASNEQEKQTLPFGSNDTTSFMQPPRKGQPERPHQISTMTLVKT